MANTDDHSEKQPCGDCAASGYDERTCKACETCSGKGEIDD